MTSTTFCWYQILSILFFSLATCGPFLHPHNCPELVFNLTKPDIVKPLIFIPGLGGSVLEAKLENIETRHSFCRKNKDWFWFWIGVHIRPHDVGGTGGVEYISNIFKKISCYMHYVVSFFESGGYEKGKTFRAQTYDFRLGPKEWMRNGGEFESLRNLVEDTFKINGNIKVVLMGHSLGGPFIQSFFVYFVDQEWKDKYIDRFISVSGSYDGSIDALQNMLEGNADNIWLDFRPVLWSFGGLNWMLPSRFHMDEVILITDERNYTMNELKEIMTDFGHEQAYEIYEYTLRSSNRSAPPNVNTMCVMGNKIDTTITYYFPTIHHAEDRKNHTSVRVINGDGTVSQEGLRICSDWAGQQKQKVVNKVMDGMSHTKLIMSQAGVEFVWESIYEEM